MSMRLVCEYSAEESQWFRSYVNDPEGNCESSEYTTDGTDYHEIMPNPNHYGEILELLPSSWKVPRQKSVIKWVTTIGEKATSECLQGLDKRSLEEGSDLQFLKSSSRYKETELWMKKYKQ